MISKGDLRIPDSNFYEIPNLKEEPIAHTVTDEDVNDPGRITHLYDYPFDTWAVIMRFNNIVDPINDLVPGLVIYIPSKRDLKEIELST
jgi:hypothetical protein